jgi:hypothetical protein
MNLKITVLNISKVARIMNGNYPPLICYAFGNKDYENTVCDCKKYCKYSPGTGEYV